MVNFQAVILRSETQGAAMAGWAYCVVPAAIAQQLKPGYKQVCRVRGEFVGHAFCGMLLLPKGWGDYYLAINGKMRKELEKGDAYQLKLAHTEQTDLGIVTHEE